jgi:hypothetical protein
MSRLLSKAGAWQPENATPAKACGYVFLISASVLFLLFFLEI